MKHAVYVLEDFEGLPVEVIRKHPKHFVLAYKGEQPRKLFGKWRFPGEFFQLARPHAEPDQSTLELG